MRCLLQKELKKWFKKLKLAVIFFSVTVFNSNPALILRFLNSSVMTDMFMTNHFLLPLPYYRKVMEVLFSVKIFDVEFSPDLYVLRSPESKKVVFGNWSVRMYVCVCVCDCKVNI